MAGPWDPLRPSAVEYEGAQSFPPTVSGGPASMTDQRDPVRVLLIHADLGEVQRIRLALTQGATDHLELVHVESLKAATELLQYRRCDVALIPFILLRGGDSGAVHEILEIAPDLAVLAIVEDGDPAQRTQAIAAGATDALTDAELEGGRLATAVTSAFTRTVAKRPIRILADVGEVIANARTAVDLASGLLELLVSRIAAWGIVEQVDAAGGLVPLAHRHEDAQLDSVLRSVATEYPSDPAGSYGPGLALQTGRVEVFPEIPPTMIESLAKDDEHLELLRSLDYRQSLSVALRGKEGDAGVLTLGFRSRHRPRPETIDLLEQLATRVGCALETAATIERLSRTDARKDQFLLRVAGELSDNDGPIESALEMIRLHVEKSPDAAWSTRVVQRRLQLIARLARELVDLSSATVGTLELRREAVDLSAAVGRAAETTFGLRDSRHQRLLLGVGPEPMLVMADAVRLEQILTLLLRTVVLGSERGANISLDVEREGATISLQIRGSARRPLPSDRKSEHDPEEESALALSLARRLVEMHGGRLLADSDSTDIEITLPAFQPSPKEEPVQRHAAHDLSEPLQVLVVDDHVDSATGMRQVLEHWGHEAHAAYTGPEAIRKAIEIRPDVVLLDIGIPDMNGYEIARAMLKEPQLAATRLVALTGFRDEEAQRRGREAGFSQYFTKPVDLSELRRYLSTPPT